MQVLEAQVAAWSGPTDRRPAQCRLPAATSADSVAEPECDSRALAQAMADRWPALREAMATLRRLSPDQPRSDSDTLLIAFADGRYRLQFATQ